MRDDRRGRGIRAAAIVAAAGSGKRMQSRTDKPFIRLSRRELIFYALKVLEDSPSICEIIIAASPRNILKAKGLIARYGFKKVKDIVKGGACRADSVFNALLKVSGSIDLVLIHDVARPFVSQEIIKRTIDAAGRYGASLAAVPVKPTIKESAYKGYFVKRTLDRRLLWEAQTPQVFKKDLLLAAYNKAGGDRTGFTDDASMVEKAMHKRARVVMGDYCNIKITTPDDLLFAEAIAGTTKAAKVSDTPEQKVSDTYVGIGFDIHRLVEGRPLFLGGIRIPFSKGLLGYSDGDALLHSICDAMLGACGAGDIGEHFPDEDPRYKGIDSSELLKKVNVLIRKKGYRIRNLDTIIIAQQPKLASFKRRMRERISKILNVEKERINIKAKTNEDLGDIGKGRAIASYAIVLLTKRKGG